MTPNPLATRPVLAIVSNADARFMPGLAVALSSAVAAASGDFDYRFLILDGGLPDHALQDLNHSLHSIAQHKGIRAWIEPLAIDENRLAALPERRGSRMTYAKLVLPEILSQLESIIYLDADVLCFKGIESVCPPALNHSYLLAGARDYFWVIEKDCPWLEQVPQAERQLPYINCGVMWMNLKALREMNFTDASITARAAIGEARQGDQSVFNFLCRGRSFILPDSINHRTAIGSSKQLCEGDLDLNLHYIGAPKPWLGAPKTSNWLAHRLWHQAQSMLFPALEHAPPILPTHDLSIIRRKTLLYTLVNPPRAKNYRNDIRSLTDPAGILEKAENHWTTQLPQHAASHRP